LPTYEYLCSACGQRYDKREGFDAKPRQKCQFCGKPANRVLHAPPVVFKGSGFYKTDSRGSSSTTTDSSSPATPAIATDDHGHSHGPGGHSHDAPTVPETTATESATAG
jgi:putative FmdB family regulatory protein